MALCLFALCLGAVLYGFLCLGLCFVALYGLCFVAKLIVGSLNTKWFFLSPHLLMYSLHLLFNSTLSLSFGDVLVL